MKKILDHLFNRGEIRKVETEFYPDPVSSRSQVDFSPKMRGLIFNEIEKCTGCGDCVKTCPVDAIVMETQENPNQPRRLWVSRFDVDFSKCIFCGLCVEVCEPESLVQTKEVQPAGKNPSDLMTRFGRGSL